MKLRQPAAVTGALVTLTVALACSLLPAQPETQPTLDVRSIVQTSVAQNAAVNTEPTATPATPTIWVPIIMPATATAEPTTLKMTVTTAPTALPPKATPLPTAAGSEDPTAKLLFNPRKTPAVTPTVKRPTVTRKATATPPLPPATYPPTATSTPEPPAPTATANPSNQALTTEHADAKRYMLKLINAERAKAGVPTVTMGENPAAQLHANTSNEHCFISHWGRNGLKPYMRYTLTGDYQSNGENAYSRQSCYGETAGRYIQWDLESEVTKAVRDWMKSPGHRDNMLQEHWRKVNIGIAYGHRGINMYQHFAGDYVSFNRHPAINGNTLQMSGTTRNGIALRQNDNLVVTVSYDQPPRELTLGQLLRTKCYGLGTGIAGIRPPPEKHQFYTKETFPILQSGCPDPYRIPADTPNASSIAEAQRIEEAVNRQYLAAPRPKTTIPWITANHWEVKDNAFSIAADIGQLLEENGPGVYTVGLISHIENNIMRIALYSIFHRTKPPDLYGAP